MQRLEHLWCCLIIWNCRKTILLSWIHIEYFLFPFKSSETWIVWNYFDKTKMYIYIFIYTGQCLVYEFTVNKEIELLTPKYSPINLTRITFVRFSILRIWFQLLYLFTQVTSTFSVGQNRFLPIFMYNNFRSINLQIKF